MSGGPRWKWLAALIAALIIVGGAWWIYFGRFAAGGAPDSPVQVVIVTPASGDQISLGDYLPIAVRAESPAGIRSVELFIDEQSIDRPDQRPAHATWTWQAIEPGLHTLVAHATAADGEVGESQVVLIDVLKNKNRVQVRAENGEMLLDIGQKFGLQAFAIGEANPQLDPLVPRHGGQPVTVPADAFLAKRGSAIAAEAAAQAQLALAIDWQLTLTREADKAYCYLSDGSGVWRRVPAAPYQFFESNTNLFTQVLESLGRRAALQADCWAWSQGTLQYLGHGESAFDPGEKPETLEVFGEGFQLAGTTHFHAAGPEAAAAQAAIRPPYALREPRSAAECMNHKGNAQICDAVLNNPIRTDVILVWEWLAGLEWGGRRWINAIDGYRIYEIDPVSKSMTFIKRLDPAQKAAALPMPRSGHCYAVRAYVDGARYGGLLQSDIAAYCPRDVPTTQQVTLTPAEWLTSGGLWSQDYSCAQGEGESIYGSREKSTGFGNAPGQVLVGSYIVQDPGTCYREGDYAAGIKFPDDLIPAGAVLQGATLAFRAQANEFEASGRDLGPPPETCVAEVGAAKREWIGLDGGDHSSTTWITDASYYEPYTSVTEWGDTALDITSMVQAWIADPRQNHGLILAPTVTPTPDGRGSGRCLSWLGDVQLILEYITP